MDEERREAKKSRKQSKNERKSFSGKAKMKHKLNEQISEQKTHILAIFFLFASLLTVCLCLISDFTKRQE